MTINLGRNPEKGGNPPKDKKFTIIFFLVFLLFLKILASLLILFFIRVITIESVIIV